MPKRKSEVDYEKLLKKIKKLEKKMRRERRRSRSRSQENRNRSKSQERKHTSSGDSYDVVECDVTELLGRDITPEPEPRAETHAPATGREEERDVGLASQHLIEPPVDTTAASSTEPTTSASLTINACKASGITESVLDSAILEILGDDPTISNNYGDEIHKDLAVRLEHLVSHGLSKELRKELNMKYLLPSNCKLINAPILNAEIKVAVSEMTTKRDKNIENRQKQQATAIACLSQAINRLISQSNPDKELINLLMDSERLLCDSQYSDTVVRRNFILSSLKKEMKEQLQNSKADSMLFGQNLSETIKSAKAINKSGAELKTPMPKPQAFNNKKSSATTTNASKNLNWKGPYPARKQTNLPKTKDPPPNRNRPSNSSRNSQQQPTRGRR